MNVFSKPQESLSDFSGAVAYFQEHNISGTPELHLITYQLNHGNIEIPAWLGVRSDGCPAAVPVFAIPPSVKNPAFAMVSSDVLDKGTIYSNNGILYMAIETDNGIGFFQINVIYNSYIAGVMAQVLELPVDCAYRLRAFNVYDADGRSRREYYWVGYPKHGEDPATFSYPAFSAFYLDKPLEVSATPELEKDAEIVEENEFFFKNNTLWRTSRHDHLGLCIRAEYDPDVRDNLPPQ